MTIDLSGLNAKLCGGEISIQVDSEDSLLKLGNILNWEKIYEIISSDLKKTAAGSFNVGRKIQIRSHLGTYVLQSMHNETDRGTEQRLKSDARWQVFCGLGTIPNWKAPDHTKIEKFRNRLSEATHHAIGTEILRSAKEAGFTKPDWMDVDSTVQEANISYPSDATLMLKVAQKAKVLADGMTIVSKKIEFDLKTIKEKAKEYFFIGKTKAIEIKRKVFASLHEKVVSEFIPVAEAAFQLTEDQIQRMSKKAQNAMAVILHKAIGLLEDIRVFMKTQKMVPTKILSLHAELVACISKGKQGKPHEFGRVFQLGRISGNFLLVGKSNSVRNCDKSAIGKMIYEHSKVFGARKLNSLGTDKCYASEKNIRSAKAAGVQEIAIQQPCTTKNGKLEHSPERKVELENRRAGIEPLIGHCKRGGLGKSRMKSDAATESSAYRSVTGFNLRQMSRHIPVSYTHLTLPTNGW
jgi:IS5 family transposase